MDKFTGNSNAKKNKSDVSPSEKNITPVTNNVVVRKESESKKFVKQFISEDAGSVKGHIFINVIVPGIQRLLSDTVKNLIDGIIYGVSGIRSDRGGARNISYSSYYDRNRYGSSPIGGYSNLPPIPQQSYVKSNVYSVNDVSFGDRGEAEEVLFRLKEEIERYGMVSIGDFYDMIGQKHAHTDLRYGWRDLRNANVERVRDGYSIKFPKITPLEI